MKASPVTDTYHDVEKMIFKICHNFRGKFGGDFEEHLAVANEVFMDVYNTVIDSTKGSFNTMLYTSIWRRLSDVSMYQQRRKMLSIDTDSTSTSGLKSGKIYGGGFAGEISDDSVSPFNFDEFTEEITDDAKTVLQLVLQAPAELEEMAESKGGAGRNWRSSLRVYLAKNLGWAADRVAESFEEIQFVLKGR